MPFYKTLDTLEEGPLSWTSEYDIFGTRLEKILNKPHMTPDLPDNQFTAVGGGVGNPITLTFIAPEDLTIKNLIIYPLNRNNLVNTIFINDVSTLMMLGRMSVVSGVGPDVGVPLYEGLGRPIMTVFGIRNISFAPTLNIRMSAGDVLEIDIEGTSDIYYAFSMVLPYERGIDLSVKPKIILGGTMPPVSGTVIGTGGTTASATLSVNVSSTTDTIYFRKESSFIDPDEDLDSLIVGVPGGTADAYNSTAGSATAIRDDIIDVITVRHSNVGYWSDWTIAPSGTTDIIFTRVDTGAGGNFDIIYSSSSDFTATLFTGGTTSIDSLPMSSPTIDILITDIYSLPLLFFSNNPAPINIHCFDIVDLEVNGSSASIGRVMLPPNVSRAGIKKVNVPVLAGQTLDLLVSFSGTDTIPLYALIVAERI